MTGAVPPVHPPVVESLVGVFRCFLPVRYWQEMRRGAYLSIFLTAALGVRIGYAGFFELAQKTGEDGAKLALKVGAPGGGVKGMGQTDAVAAALQGSALVPFAFFLFTPMGWLADYLFISAVFRGISLAGDHPWGDPILTVVDNLVRGKRADSLARRQAEERELQEGPEVPDQILECRKFAGKEADFVVVSSRRKEGWTLHHRHRRLRPAPRRRPAGAEGRWTPSHLLPVEGHSRPPGGPEDRPLRMAERRPRFPTSPPKRTSEPPGQG